MRARTGTAQVVTTTGKVKGRTNRTHLLRRNSRADGSVKNETLGSLSHLPDPPIGIIRRSLQGETFVPLADAVEIIRSGPHGHDVEPAFRSIKTVDLKVRPIHHRAANRVRANILPCMLACHLEWHMRAAWRAPRLIKHRFIGKSLTTGGRHLAPASMLIPAWRRTS